MKYELCNPLYNTGGTYSQNYLMETASYTLGIACRQHSQTQWTLSFVLESQLQGRSVCEHTVPSILNVVDQ